MIEFTADKILRAETLLGEIKGALPKVQSNAINRSLVSARAEAVRSVRQEYAIGADAVRKTIVVRIASMANPVGCILSSGSPIALSKFDVSPKRPQGGKNQTPVTVRVKLAGGRKPIKHAFVAKVSSGHIGVFIRAGKKRYPIKQLYGPSVPQMLGSEKVSKKIEAKAMETLDKRLDHEINRVLEAGRI